MRQLLPAAEQAGSSGRGEGISPRRTWDEHFHAYLSFIDRQGRAPSQYAEDPGERALFYWLRNQRSSLRNGLLLRERIEKLNQALPDWSKALPCGFRSSSTTQAKWNNRAEQLAEYLRGHGKPPGTGRSRPEAERALGKWLALQRYALKKGTLYPERAARLDDLVPGWRPPGGKLRM